LNEEILVGMSKMSVRDIIDDSIPTMILGSIQRLIEGPERLQKNIIPCWSGEGVMK